MQLQCNSSPTPVTIFSGNTVQLQVEFSAALLTISSAFSVHSGAFSNSRAVSVQLLRKLKPRCSSVAISIENLMAVSSAEFRNVFNNTFHFSPIGGFFRVTIQCRVSALRTAPDEISLHRRFEDRQDARTILFDTFEDSLKM